MMYKHIFTFFIFSVLWINLQAINPRFKYITSSDGISQSEIYAFCEDSRGYMWIGTLDGLNRYDGYEISVFNMNSDEPNALPNNTVRSLTEDAYGRVWIGTNNGLAYYDPEDELIYPIEFSGEKSRVNFSIHSLFSNKEYLLLGTSQGLYQIELRGEDMSETEITSENKITLYNLPHLPDIPFESLPILKILDNEDGSFWLMIYSDIFRIKISHPKKQGTIIEIPSVGSTAEFRIFEKDNYHNLWLISNMGVIRYNYITKRMDTFHLSHNSTGEIVKQKLSSIIIDKKSNMWIGTLDNGLFYIDRDQINKQEIHFQHIRHDPIYNRSLNSNLIYSLYVSKDNLLWVGTIGSGVNIFNPEQKEFNHYSIQTVKLQNTNFVRSVFTDDENHIYAGLHGSGLHIINRKSGEINKIGFGTESVYHITTYQKDELFIGSSLGISIYNKSRNTITPLNIESIGAVFYIEKSKENTYWLAGYEGVIRLEIIDGKVINTRLYHNKSKPYLSHHNCRVLLFDEANNELYIGTEGGGLNVMKLNKEHEPLEIKVYQKNENQNSLSNNYVRTLYKSRNNTLWVGTFEGLNKLINENHSVEARFKAYTQKNGLPNNMVQFITEDEMGFLWLGTNNGLVKFNPDKEQSFLFTQDDGLQSNEFSEHTVYKSETGEIIIGGINGINTFYPQNIILSKINPNILITNFYIQNKHIKANQKMGRNIPLKKSISLTDSIFLLPDQNNISFDFSAMLFSNPLKVKYKYKLEGFDTDWNTTDAKMRNAKYTNLPYGKYIFKVKASNADGKWNDQTREIAIKIKTPFALTWYAFFLYAVILILVFLYFSYFSIIRQTTKNKLLLEHDHNQKIQELNQLRTRFFINVSHDLRTPLTLISGPINNLLEDKKITRDVKEKLHLVKRNVKRLNYLVEQVLDVRKAESGKLKPNLKKQDIVAFIKSESLHFKYAIQKKELKLVITSAEDSIYAYFDSTMISKVIFNLISNAIKYTSKGGIYINIRETENVAFNAKQDEKLIEIEVRDTGRGIANEIQPKIFERFYQDALTIDKGYGIGLSHCKDLIEAHSGTIVVESAIGEGTCFRFTIPANNNALEYNVPLQTETSTEDIYVSGDKPDLNDNPKSAVKKAKKVLVVEDNSDMRYYIKNNLSHVFNVIEAEDGIDGYDKAEKGLPDIIISDVMMPNMNGIEFCKKIKTNLNTSHIPVILLTAKVDTKSKYEGIETGADDYIPKPFEMEYLIIRIQNLLQIRETLREKFQKSVSFEPKAVTVTSIDEKFLTDLMNILENAIPDFEFPINAIEEKLGMSHSTFYRKVKSLTGKSAKEILQEMRMKRAYQISSETKGIRINELAYMVGFSNAKYFSKCFKERFGFLPSEMKS